MSLLAVGLALPIIAGPVTAANEILGQVLKGAAVGLVVIKAAKPLDEFINTVTLRRGMQSKTIAGVISAKANLV